MHSNSQLGCRKHVPISDWALRQAGLVSLAPQSAAQKSVYTVGHEALIHAKQTGGSTAVGGNVHAVLAPPPPPEPPPPWIAAEPPQAAATEPTKAARTARMDLITDASS